MVVERACAGAAPRSILVQLRHRRLATRDLQRLADRLRKITSEHGARLMVNDRVDVALATGADGVHLPAAGMNVDHARKLLGPDLTLGRSVHSIEEIRALADAPLDYLQYGPIYATPSKAAYGAPQGEERFKEAVDAAAARPLVAVGGINAERAARLCVLGAAGVAVIGAIARADDPATAINDLLSALEQNWPPEAVS